MRSTVKRPANSHTRPICADGLDLCSPTNHDSAGCSDIGLVFYVIFLAEFWIKVLGFGFMFTPDAYIKDPWYAHRPCIKCGPSSTRTALITSDWV